MKFDKIIEIVNNIIKEFEGNGLNVLNVDFSKGLEKSYDTKKRSIISSPDVPTKVTYFKDITLLKLLLKALKGECNIDEFSDILDETFCTKPHEILIVNKKNYKKNTITFSCSDRECCECFEMFTCHRNGSGKIYISITVQPEYVIFETREELSDNDIIGETPERVFRFKQNEHMNLFFGKLLYKIISENYVLNGFSNTGGKK
ncbi:MAG: hypothetical protein ACRCZ9_05625 [Fusobacteriaceae bacterium]